MNIDQVKCPKLLLVLTLLLTLNLEGREKTSIPIMETLFGPTTTNACAGNGRLTVGISKYGELVNLKWPCSNYFDHLNYRAAPVIWGRKVEDYDRYLNAGEKLGSFPVLQYQKEGKQFISPLRSAEWMSRQGYLNPNAPIVVTFFENKALGLTVECVDLVPAQQDLLYRHFKIKKTAEVGLSYLQLHYLSNMAPCNEKPDFDPGADWVDDRKNGFLNLYDQEQRYFISFNPNAESKKGKSKIPQNENDTKSIQAFIANLDSLYPAQSARNNIDLRDIYCLIGSSRATSQGLHSEDGDQRLSDLLKPNSKIISKSPSAIVLSQDLAFSNSSLEEVDIIFAFGNSLKKASAIFAESKSKGYSQELAETLRYWDQKLAQAKIPQTHDEAMQQTLKRILINILLSTNGDGGGIGSSVVSTQPPYTMLWPRDSAIMGFVLDLAGFHEEAEKNSLFYTTVQRKKDGEFSKKPLKFEAYQGTWFQCYYADGRPSWAHEFEIDEVGWSIWMFYIHSRFLKEEAKVPYLKKVFPSIELAADFLVKFKDPFSKLQKRAKEDDVLWEDQSIYGAASVLLGLKSAVSAAKALNETEKQARWQGRADELEVAIQKHLWNEGQKEYQKPIYGNFGGRAIILWPTLLASSENRRVQLHADGLLRQINPFFTKSDAAKNREWWYLGKATTAIAFAARSDSVKLEASKRNLEILLKEACTPDTRVYGETPMVRDFEEMRNERITKRREYDNRVGQPSNHPAAWVYMTAEMLYGENYELLHQLYTDR